MFPHIANVKLFSHAQLGRELVSCYYSQSYISFPIKKSVIFYMHI